MIRYCSPIVLIALLALAGCDKDKPKVEDKKPESTPVPSGLVFNDFAMPGSAAGLTVRDAGLEGGLAGVGGGEPGPGDQAQPGEAAAGKVAIKVVEPGAEPRAVRKYTFVPNKVDKRIVTVTQSMTQSAGGQSAPPQEVTLKIALEIATKQVKPTGATLEIKVTKIDLPGAPPQVAPMLAQMNGLSGTFDVTPNGDVGEVQFSGTPQMQNQLAETVLGTMSQAVQLLLAPLPTTPVGVGAKWEMVAKNEAEQNVRRFTLKEVSNEGGVIESEVEMKAPKRMQQNPRGGPPASVEGDGKGKNTQYVRFNQVVTKGEGDQTLTQKIELNDPRAGGKQTATVVQKTHNVIETPGAK